MRIVICILGLFVGKCYGIYCLQCSYLFFQRNGTREGDPDCWYNPSPSNVFTVYCPSPSDSCIALIYDSGDVDAVVRDCTRHCDNSDYDNDYYYDDNIYRYCCDNDDYCNDQEVPPRDPSTDDDSQSIPDAAIAAMVITALVLLAIVGWCVYHGYKGDLGEECGDIIAYILTCESKERRILRNKVEQLRQSLPPEVNEIMHEQLERHGYY